MAEHYTKNTTEVTAWCAKCQAETQHRVDGGRRGPCLKCIGFRINSRYHFPEAPKCAHCDRPFPEDCNVKKDADTLKVFCGSCWKWSSFAIDHEAAMSKKQLAAKKKREHEKRNPSLF